MRRNPRGAEVDRTAPRAFATCDACGLIFNHFKLNWRMDWRGSSIENLHILVCDKCLDVPQRQLGTIILPVDPPSIMNARPEPYAIDEVSPENYITSAGDFYVTGTSSAFAVYYVSSAN